MLHLINLSANIQLGFKTLTGNNAAHFSELWPIIYNPETCPHFINSRSEKSIQLNVISNDLYNSIMIFFWHSDLFFCVCREAV